MARMLPATLPRDLPSPAEPLVFEALRDDPRTAGWTVLHSLDIARHVVRPFGEADFVVIVPGWGVVVIEVKGVRSIARLPDGTWLLGKKADPDPVGPFRQARDAMFSIREDLRSRVTGARFLSTALVLFPFIEFGMSSTEWESWEYADRPRLERDGYISAIEQAMEGQVRRLGGPRGATLTTSQAVDSVVTALRPSFEVNVSPRQRLADLEAQTRTYTEEQFDALDAMASNPRVLFDGAAGTGKTVLAIEAARRAANDGARVLLLCFNRLLGDHLRDEVASLPGVEAATIHAHMVRTAGTAPDGGDDRRFWDVVLPDAATTAALERGPSVDVLIIDEAQDILPDTALRTYLDAVLVGELAGGRWDAFGDFTNQVIFAESATLPDEFSAVPRYVLSRNCRNSRSIAAAAASIGRLELGYRAVLRDDDGPALHVTTYDGEESLAPRVFEAVGALLRRGYPARDIAVLLPRADSSLATLLDVPSRRGGSADQGTTPVHTVQAFKGLESPAVVLAGIEDVTTDYWRSVLYVGITRALHEVHVIVSATARSRFDESLGKGST
jgi:hypothetical protein